MIRNALFFLAGVMLIIVALGVLAGYLAYS
jgi:sulfite exporter TauE/SafE